LSDFLSEIGRDIMENISESVQIVDNFIKRFREILIVDENSNEKLNLMYRTLRIFSRNKFSSEENLKLISMIDRIFEMMSQEVGNEKIRIVEELDTFVEIFQDKKTYISCPDCNFGCLVYKDSKEIQSCNQCNKRNCSQCLTFHESHECQQEDIDKAKQNIFVKCPNCQIAIHFIDGCSQMFCTNCHIKFDKTT